MGPKYAALIRNKLQSLEIALGLLSGTEYDTKEIVKKMLEDLNEATELLDRMDVLSLDDYRNMAYKEKREFPRVDLNVNVEWQKVSSAPKGPLTTSAISKNISGGGICLITKEKNIEIGDRWHLKLKLSTEDVIESEGKVAWFTEIKTIDPVRQNWYKVGIEFLAIDNKDREIIKQFIEKEKPKK